jgi:DNA-binding FadR family transcriptional regulator
MSTRDGLQVSPVVAPKRAEIAAAQIRGQIIRGELAPGQPLPAEGELMIMFGLSRPTVREALRVLESEALITVRRGGGGGARVREPDVAVAANYAGAWLQYRGATVDDVFAARIALEPAAVRMLATDRPATGLAMLRQALDAERNSGPDTERFRDCATATHSVIVRATGNQTMTLFVDMVAQIVARHAQLAYDNSEAVKLGERFRASHRVHEQVWALINDGAADEAEQMWRRHLDKSRRAMRQAATAPVLDLFKD